MKRTIFVIWVTIFVFSLGNTAYPQWIQQKSNLPEPGRVFIVSAVDEDTAWAMGVPASFNGFYNGFTVTRDGGNTWTANTVSSAPATFRNSNIHALNSQTAWMAMYDASDATSGGIFKTTDGGATWVQQTSAFPNPGGFVNFVHFFDAANGLCAGDPNGGYFEIYTTTNGGDNWVRVPQPNIPAPLPNEVGFTTNYYFSGDSNVWFGTNAGRVFRTINRGISWNVSDPGLGDFIVQCAFQNTDTGLVIAATTTAMAKTTDGGATWTRLATPAPLAGLITYVPGTISTYFICATYFAPRFGSAYTNDGGTSWTLIDNDDHFPAIFVNPTTGWSGSNSSTVIYKWAGPALSVEASSPQLPREMMLSQNYPNPFWSAATSRFVADAAPRGAGNSQTIIKFALPKAARVKIKIYNVLGQPVATILDAHKSAGYHAVTFDAQGLESGIYFYRIEAGQDFTDTKKMLLIK